RRNEVCLCRARSSDVHGSRLLHEPNPTSHWTTRAPTRCSRTTARSEDATAPLKPTIHAQPFPIVQRQAAWTHTVIVDRDPCRSVVLISRRPSTPCAEERLRRDVGLSTVVGHGRSSSCRSIHLFASSGSTSSTSAISVERSRRAFAASSRSHGESCSLAPFG